MRTLVPLLVLAIVALLAPSASAQTVRADHPRLLLTPERLAELREVGSEDADVAGMQAWVNRRLADPSGTATTLAGRYPELVVQTTAFIAAVLREQRYVDAAIEYSLTIARMDPDSDWDTGTRNRLYAMSLAYDWLYADLSSAERQTIRDGMVAHARRAQDHVEDPDFVSGHTRYGNVVILAAVLAMRGDDTRLDDLYDDVVANWRDGYNATLAVIGEGGGHHMGWMYGSSYSSSAPYLMWRSATGELWLPSFMHDSAFFYLYAVNAEYQVPPFGDCWDLDLPPAATTAVAVSSAIGGNPYAEAFFQELPTLYEPNRLLRAITSSTAAAPRPLTELPLMRAFPGSGFVVSRDSWARADATLLVFKSSPFYSYNHHHRDQNSFTVDYRGPLLLDAGYYDGYATDHFRGFYTRTVAHNALLVHWDEEPIRANHPNDGGQRIPLGWDEEPATIEEVRGDAALEGLAAYADNGACTWVRGDASSAYHEGKLDSYLRDVLMVRRPDGRAHPSMLVVDRASLPVARPAELSWHFAEEARVEGARIHAENPGGGHVRLDVLAPDDAAFVSYSGARRWEVGGVLHPPSVEDGGVSPYWGRVSVAPPSSSRELLFSTFVSVDEEEMTDARLPPPVELGGAGWVGARSGDTIFAVLSGAPARLELPAGGALATGCVGGLPPNGSIVVAVDGQEPVTVYADAEGLALFDPDAIGPPPVDVYALPRASCALEPDGDARELGLAPAITITAASGVRGEYRFAFDDSALYVTASIDDADLAAAASARDGRLWEDDALELLIGEHKFFASAAGVLGDARAGDDGWDDDGWRASVRADGTLNDGGDEDGGYTVELVIPWATLGRSAPSAGEELAVEIVLDERTSEGQSAQTPWANTNGGGINDADGFGRLRAQSGSIETCAPVVAPDAGPGGPDAGPSGGSSMSCGCALAPVSSPAVELVLVLAALVLAHRRRRR